MAKEIDSDREFSENIDRLLAGQEIGAGEDKSEDFKASIQFAQKLKGFGGEPSPVFKNQLRGQLLVRLAEQEVEEGREKRSSFWEVLRNLVPRSPVWRTATLTLVVAVLAVVVFWRSGIFIQAPEQMAESGAPVMTLPPKVTSEGPPTATLDSGAILNIEPIFEETNAYMTGEEVKIGLVFSNSGSEPIILAPFPPAIQINQADTGSVVRSFAAGSESVEISASGKTSYTLTWDQLDEQGKQVESERYLIVVNDVTLDKGAEQQETRTGFGPVAEIIIQSP